MKTKLIALDIPENVVDGILNIFFIHKETLKQYSKPKGQIALRDNMKEIESLSKKLLKRLDKLSSFEKQFLTQYSSYSALSELKTELVMLTFSCQQVSKTKTRFSKREPFLLNLTGELRDLLEAHGIPVKIYRDNILCRVLDILLDEDEPGISERSFNLVRQASKLIPSTNPIPKSVS